jgi:hypothetical protein
VHPAKRPAAAQSKGAATDADGSGSTSDAGEVEQHHGMVLPFTSVTLTFRDVHYYVPAEVRVPRRLEYWSCCDCMSARSTFLLCPHDLPERPFGARRC